MEGEYRGIFGFNILLNMPLNLAKINCITLKIRSKAEFMSKSQNIWQQIILWCTTVMQCYARDPRFELFRGDWVTGVFDLCLIYPPFGNLAVKSRHLFLCWYVLLIYFVMIRLSIVYLSYLNIDKLLQIKFVKKFAESK